MCQPGSSLARMRAPILSSWMVATNVNFFCLVKLSPFVAQSITARSGIAAWHAWDSAVYSDSIVLVAIVDYMTNTRKTGQLAILMIYPVRDLTQSGLALHSTPQP